MPEGLDSCYIAYSLMEITGRQASACYPVKIITEGR